MVNISRGDVVLCDLNPFVLISIEDWEGFEVDEDDDITQNKELMEYLAKRRSQGNRIPLAGVKAQLGLS
jgi:hypothetical protein